MSKINDGGAAFPCKTSMYASSMSGMSLRDYFAAKAMQGMAANPYWDNSGYAAIARAAYAQADEMLAAREVAK